MIKKTTATEWNQAAKAPGALLKHRKRGTAYSFTLIDQPSGRVVGLALCDRRWSQEDYLLETFQKPLDSSRGITTGELLSAIERKTWAHGVHLTATA